MGHPGRGVSAEFVRYVAVAAAVSAAAAAAAIAAASVAAGASAASAWAAAASIKAWAFWFTGDFVAFGVEDYGAGGAFAGAGGLQA